MMQFLPRPKSGNQGVAMGMVPLTVISKHTQNFCILSPHLELNSVKVLFRREECLHWGTQCSPESDHHLTAVSDFICR